MSDPVAEESAVVLLVDALSLRRAGITGLLRDWSEIHHVLLRQCAPHELDEEDMAHHHYSLCILSLGSLSVLDAKPAGWVDQIMARFPDIPLVILSDRIESEEAVGALKLGAQGYVPTTTPPQVAMNALSFIMGGGTFFPPGALIASALRQGGKGRATGRRRPETKGDGNNRSDLRTLLFQGQRTGAHGSLERGIPAIIGLDAWRVGKPLVEGGVVARSISVPRPAQRRKATILPFVPDRRHRR